MVLRLVSLSHSAGLSSLVLAMFTLTMVFPHAHGHRYKQFESEHDRHMMKWVNEFNKFDL